MRGLYHRLFDIEKSKFSTLDPRHDPHPKTIKKDGVKTPTPKMPLSVLRYPLSECVKRPKNPFSVIC